MKITFEPCPGCGLLTAVIHPKKSASDLEFIQTLRDTVAQFGDNNAVVAFKPVPGKLSAFLLIGPSTTVERVLAMVEQGIGD